LGGNGDDTIVLRSSVIGGAGAATVDGGPGSDSIHLSTGTSAGRLGRVLGGAGNDTIALDDTILSVGGSVFDGRSGTDFLSSSIEGAGKFGIGGGANFESVVTSPGSNKER
jgi:hypothetical protein